MNFNKYALALAAKNHHEFLQMLQNHAKPAHYYSQKDLESLNDECQSLHNQGAMWITYDDDLYPSPLRTLSQPPVILFAKGRIDLLRAPCIGIVGARNASLAAAKLAESTAAYLGQCGFVVVSGLAKGIDAAAHEGSLATGTIAVLGQGLDIVYPAENHALMQATAKQGLLLSEFRIGTPPRAQNFPRRNRIIAALANALVIIEAAAKSGSLVTARYALELGKDISVVPGFPTDPRYAGSIKLLQEGASLFSSAQDFIEPYFTPHSMELSKKIRHIPQAEVNSLSLEDAISTKILNCISHVPSSIDEIIRKCQTSKDIVLAAIGRLELLGAIQRTPQNQVVKT